MIWKIVFEPPQQLIADDIIDVRLIRAFIREHIAMAVVLDPGEYDITPIADEFSANHVLRVHDDGTATHYSIPRYSDKATLEHELSAEESLEGFMPPTVIEMRVPDQEEIVLLGKGEMEHPNAMLVYCIAFYTDTNVLSNF